VSLKVPVETLDVWGSPEDIRLLESVLPDVESTGNVRSHTFHPEEGASGLRIEVVLGEPEPKR
jgi:hypothetical protein